jgi:hypothetical protein
VTEDQAIHCDKDTVGQQGMHATLLCAFPINSFSYNLLNPHTKTQLLVLFCVTCLASLSSSRRAKRNQVIISNAVLI